MNTTLFRRTSSPVSWIASLLLLVLASCSGPIPLSRSTENTGTLSISVPRIATWVSEQLNAQPAGSRAYIIADSVKVEVKTAGGADVIPPVTATWTIGTDYNPAYQKVMSDITNIPAGTGYTVVVSVYNHAVSTTEPQVRGQITGVAVTDGSVTPVAVICKPVNPTPITIDGGVVTESVAPNGERWYVANLNAGTPYYIDSEGPFAVFDQDGLAFSQGYPYIPFVDSVIYIGAIDFDGFYGFSAKGATSVSIATTMMVRSEGTLEGPISLVLDQEREFRLAASSANSPSYYSFTATESGIHAIETKFSTFSYKLFSDQDFTVQIDAGNYVSFGQLTPSLTSGSTYYLAITSNYSTNQKGLGSVLTPTTIASSSLSEGSATSPIDLTLGEDVPGRVGFRSFDTKSYYRFTTDANGHTAIDFTVSGPNSDLLSLWLDADPITGSSSDFSLQTSTADHIYAQLAPSTTYYLRVTNGYQNARSGESANYTLTVTTSSSAPEGVNEGSQGSPVQLPLNTLHTIKAGSYNSGYSTSYYWFETTGAGDYALDLEGSGANTYLYSDATFSTLVASNVYGYGCVFPDLLGSTVYYIKITNSTGTRISHPGRVVDPTTLTTTSENEGSQNEPLSLTLGTPHSGKAGKSSYDFHSYYQFTTGDDVDYTITTPSVSGMTLGFLSANPEYNQISDYFYVTDGTQLRVVLSPRTTYYLQFSNMVMSSNVAVNYTVRVDATPVTTFTPLPISSTPTTSAISTKYSVAWFEADVTGGSTYQLSWSDLTVGSLGVSAFNEDRTASYFRDLSSSSSPKSIEVPSGESKVYVFVRVPGASANIGAFSLKLELVP